MSEIPTTPPELTDEQIDAIFQACGGHYGVSLRGPNQHVFARAILAAQAPAEPVAIATVLRGGTKQFGYATVLSRWEDGADKLPLGEHKLYAHPKP